MHEYMPWVSTIVVAFITAIFSYLGVRHTAKSSFEVSVTKMQEQIKGVKEDISRLEKKQDAHNKLIERTYKLEQKVDDLEKGVM